MCSTRPCGRLPSRTHASMPTSMAMCPCCPMCGRCTVCLTAGWVDLDPVACPRVRQAVRRQLRAAVGATVGQSTQTMSQRLVGELGSSLQQVRVHVIGVHVLSVEFDGVGRV